jgi:hypothetical protein
MNKNKVIPNYRKLVYKLRWSPELEVEFPAKTDIDKLHSRYDKFLGDWKVTTDGSLDNGLEFKPKDSHKLYFKDETFEEIREILHLIKGHKGKVTKTCGLHIHVDMSSLNDAQVAMIVREFIHKQTFIIKKFKVRKERLEDMCKLLPRNGLSKITPKTINLIRTTDSWSLPSYPSFQDKHHALNILNLRNYGTLEFRLFEPTTDVREIKKIIKWLFEFLIDSLERE